MLPSLSVKVLRNDQCHRWLVKALLQYILSLITSTKVYKSNIIPTLCAISFLIRHSLMIECAMEVFLGFRCQIDYRLHIISGSSVLHRRWYSWQNPTCMQVYASDIGQSSYPNSHHHIAIQQSQAAPGSNLPHLPGSNIPQRSWR